MNGFGHCTMENNRNIVHIFKVRVEKDITKEFKDTNNVSFTLYLY